MSKCEVYRKLQVWSSSLSIYCWCEVKRALITEWTEGAWLSALILGTAGILSLGLRQIWWSAPQDIITTVTLWKDQRCFDLWFPSNHPKLVLNEQLQSNVNQIIPDGARKQSINQYLTDCTMKTKHVLFYFLSWCTICEYFMWQFVHTWPKVCGHAFIKNWPLESLRRILGTAGI